MACRTNTSPDWTSDPILALNLKSGYMILHNILAESLEHIAFDLIHDSIVINTEGEFGVPQQFVAMSQTVGWLFANINSRNQSEGPKRDRVANASIGSLQKQFFLVLIGVMLVYEGDAYNKFVDRISRSKKTTQEISILKKVQKDTTCLKQLINTKFSSGSKRLKALSAPTSTHLSASNKPIVKSTKTTLTPAEKAER